MGDSSCGVRRRADLPQNCPSGRRDAPGMSQVFDFMVPPPRLERGTPRSTIWCSNQLSYGGTSAGRKLEASPRQCNAEMQEGKRKFPRFVAAAPV